MNIFSDKKRYGAKYSIVESRKFSEEEKSEVTKAIVVASQYGNSCCFFMKNGTTVYIPMANDAKSDVGDAINLNNAEILILERPGDPRITRILG